MKIKRLAFCILSCYFAFAVRATLKRCSQILSNGDTMWYCCDNTAEINGKCVECPDGFKSDYGEECVQCSSGTFGRKCAEKCTCEINRCDHVNGCLNHSEMSTLFFDPHRVNLMSRHSVSTGIIVSIQKTTTNKLAEDMLGTIEDFPGLLKREIVIYSIVAGGVIIAILICALLLRRFQKNSMSNNSSNRVNINVGTDSSQFHFTNEGPERIEPIYEIIDESKMFDTPNQFQIHPPEISSGSSEANSTDSDVAPGRDVNLHHYSLAYVHQTDVISTDSESDKNTSSYFQTNVSNIDNHQIDMICNDNGSVDV